MYNKLKIYYYLTPLPFVMLLLGAFLFRGAITNTLANNPHPQINYAIFVLIVVGAVFILDNLRRLRQEAEALAQFADASRKSAAPGALQTMAMNCEADVGYVLRMIASSSGRALSQREQATLEKELSKTEYRLGNRHTLPQHITNLLVGMGLLGTFIGLLATLGDIAALISSFSTLDMKTADPVEVFRTLVERMKAPMYSMGIAFSASLYGLLGSIILGFMMVSLRRFMQDLVSLLGAEVAQHVQFALAHELIEASAARADAGPGTPTAAAAAPAALLAIEGAGPALTQQWYQEELRALRRIEDRIAESVRLQEGALRTEIEQFGRQRAEFIRAIADQAELVSGLRSELQRVGGQLGALTANLDRGNLELMTQLDARFGELLSAAGEHSRSSARTGDLMTRMADDSADMRRLLASMHDHAAASDPRADNAALAAMLQTAFREAIERLIADRAASPDIESRRQ